MKMMTLLLGMFSPQLVAGELSFPDAFIYEEINGLGGYPPYQVTVFSDGTAFFERRGDARAVVKLQNSQDLFIKIVNLTRQYNFRELRDDYGFLDEDICKERWSDNPSKIMSLQLSGKVKTIYHDHGCRGFFREKELNEFEEKLEKLLQVEAYRETKRQ